MTCELKEGQWAVFGNNESWNRAPTYDVGLIKRVTAKLVYAEAGYRRQHNRDNVIGMPDEASARLFVERVKSAFAEARRREIAAWDAYKVTVGKLCASAMSAGTAETVQPAQGQSPASAVPQADAQNTSEVSA